MKNTELKKKFEVLAEEELAKQLRCPDGDNGTAVADKMNATNITMTRSGIKSLPIADKDVFLEIGHGNCGHLAEIMIKAVGVRYYGLDISKLMQQEATRINDEYVANGSASFIVYDGEKIPFEMDFFDKIMTVNTLYFWKYPAVFLEEIYRVLKPEGKVCIVFALAESMKKAPVTAFGFTLYDHAEIEGLIAETSFGKATKIIEEVDQFTLFDGEIIERRYVIVSLQK